jgi:large subunit ribosomal protein L30
MSGSKGKTVKVTLVKSTAGHLKNIAASVQGLGLRKIRQSVVVQDTPENRGMIRAAGHLVKVEDSQAENGR